MKSNSHPRNWSARLQTSSQKLSPSTTKTWPQSWNVSTDFHQLRSRTCWFVVVVFWISRPGNCPECDGECAQNTSLYAHTFFVVERVTFHSCERCMAQIVQGWKESASSFLCSLPSRSLMSLLNVPYRPFRQVLSSPTGSLSRPPASSTCMGRSCRENHCASAPWGFSGRMANTPPNTSSNKAPSNCLSHGNPANGMTVKVSFKKHHGISIFCPWFRPFVSWKTYPNV